MYGACELTNRHRTLTNCHRRDFDLLIVDGTETQGHFVQFYERDEFLIETISHLTVETLSVGDTSVLIATNSHLTDIELRLVKHGFDLSLLRVTGRYIVLDADETLSRLMLNDWPNTVRFNAIVGRIIRRAVQQKRNRVFVFGEMVDILCARDKPHAAICLEQLWNMMSRRYPLSLWCAYKLSNFLSEAALNVVFRICEEHCLTIPAESVF